MSFESIGDIAGPIGVARYLGSYFLLQAGFIRGQTYTYAGMNLVAASLVLYDLQQNFNLSSALIQISWIVISLVGITRLWILSRNNHMSPEEERFVASKLPGLPRHVAKRLLSEGHWNNGAPGTVLAREGEQVRRLVYMATGSAGVSRDGHRLATCGDDTFIGELSCLEGAPATATVVLEAPSRYFSVETERLIRLSRVEPDLKTTLHASFTNDARLKLIAANERQRRFERGLPAEAE